MHTRLLDIVNVININGNSYFICLLQFVSKIKNTETLRCRQSAKRLTKWISL